MPRRLYTTQNLLDECRSQLDESNTDTVDDSKDLLPALNRALDYAGSILAKRYPDPFIKQSILPLVGGQNEYDIPEDCFEDRVLKVELNTNNQFWEIRRLSFYDAGKFETGTASVPEAYSIVGRKIRVLPSPTGSHSLRIWYFRQPEELVAPQGRITVVNTAGNYIVVDTAGADLSTESDTLESYVNIVDGQTGAIKFTGQIQSIDESRIMFRTTATRASATVLNRPVELTLPTSIELDDWICSVRGTCVPEFSQPVSNFLIQYTVAEITRKLGGDAQTEDKILDKFEKQVGGTWSGRENTARIQNRSRALSRNSGRRKWPITQSNS